MVKENSKMDFESEDLSDDSDSDSLSSSDSLKDEESGSRPSSNLRNAKKKRKKSDLGNLDRLDLSPVSKGGTENERRRAEIERKVKKLEESSVDSNEA